MIAGDFPRHPLGLTQDILPLTIISWSKLYLLVFSFTFLLFVLQKGIRQIKTETLKILGLPLWILAGTFFISVVCSQWKRMSSEAFVYFLVILFFIAMFSVFLEQESKAEDVWMTIAWAVLFLAAKVIRWRIHEGFRIAAYLVLNNTWVGKIQLAWVFNLFAPLLLAKYFSTKDWRWGIYGAAWVACGLAVYVLFSRAGTSIFLLSSFLVFLMHWKEWRKWLPIAAVIVAGLGWAASESPAMTDYTIKSTSFYAKDLGLAKRILIWKDSLRMFLDHPLTGIGLGTYDEVAYSQYGAPYGQDSDTRFYRGGWHAHNVFLHILAETGALGFLAWLYLLYTYFMFLEGSWKENISGERQSLAGAFFVSLLSFVLVSCLDNLLAVRVHQSLRINLTLTFLICFAVANLRPSANAGLMLKS